MYIKATLRHLHIAPRKVRLAAAVVKGMDVVRAEQELVSRTKRTAPVLLKLLRSATANARHNFHVESRDLRIKDLRIDAGPVSKRFRARAFGRAASIKRRTSHVLLVLEPTGDAAAFIAPARVRQTVPAVREATAEDMRGSAADGRASSPAAERQPQKKKSSGFMPRIFRRKAI